MMDPKDEDDIPTSKMCDECKGEGMIVTEKGSMHAATRCTKCAGTGRLPVFKKDGNEVWRDG